MWKRTIKPDDWCKKYHLFIIFHMWNATISWTPFWRSQSYFNLTRWFLIFLSKKAQNLRNGDKRLLMNTSSKFISPNCDIMIIIITLRVEVITLLFIETRWCGFYSSFFTLWGSVVFPSWYLKHYWQFLKGKDDISIWLRSSFSVLNFGSCPI